MAIVIDGNSNSATKKSIFRNMGAIPRILIALFLILVAILIFVFVVERSDRLYEKPFKQPATAFVDNFFLSGYENGEEACSSLNLTSSYESCVDYYDNEYYPNYKDVEFDYTINILYGRTQKIASIKMKNLSSSTDNFIYTEIQFQIVHVYNNDRYYEYDDSFGNYVIIDNTSSYEVLFSTIKFIA